MDHNFCCFLIRMVTSVRSYSVTSFDKNTVKQFHCYATHSHLVNGLNPGVSVVRTACSSS